MTTKIRVLLIEDHPMMIEGLKSTLNSSAHVEVAGFALNARDGLELLQTVAADVVLSDISLPDCNGIELCRKIKTEYPQLKIVALTTFNQYNYIAEMMQNGASGYVLKNATTEELLDAITAVHLGKKYFSTEVTETLLQQQKDAPSNLPRLTRREKEILKLVASGLTNQEIADQLFISILTVISHRKNLLTKFKATNTAAMINYATKHQLL
ncbi:response regulator transcription factor [Cesiribacter sp. SM1]|uniref:response regulator n=1 Tax=Cesiribacter sp. SM1 TaxID=2861196 RepID=UPI001CD77AC2|nr:response regulator transcription factor [Cesiribacter sp. SM1]